MRDVGLLGSFAHDVACLHSQGESDESFERRNERLWRGGEVMGVDGGARCNIARWDAVAQSNTAFSRPSL